MTDFDLVAADFERYRAWPDSVAEQVRAVVCSIVNTDTPILDLGAGTGRLGRAFIGASGGYIAVDLSLAMLRRFARTTGLGSSSSLVQADGARLPFRSGTVGGVLLALRVSPVLA